MTAGVRKPKQQLQRRTNAGRGFVRDMETIIRTRNIDWDIMQDLMILPKPEIIKLVKQLNRDKCFPVVYDYNANPSSIWDAWLIDDMRLLIAGCPIRMQMAKAGIVPLGKRVQRNVTRRHIAAAMLSGQRY